MCGLGVRTTGLLSRPAVVSFLALGPIQSWKPFLLPNRRSQAHSQVWKMLPPEPKCAYQALCCLFCSGKWEIQDLIIYFGEISQQTQTRGVGEQQTFLRKMPDTKYFKLVGHTVSATTTQLCHCHMGISIDNILKK